MKYLFQDQDLFKSAIELASKESKIPPSLIEKDYYVTLLLKKLNESIQGLLFKGGTCCSKAFGIINRFSEDIDLTLDEEHYSSKYKRNANHMIIDVCDDLCLPILNREFVIKNSHSNFNRYIIEYPIIFETNSLKSYVQIEMVFMEKAYPKEVKSINSILGKYLKDDNVNDALTPFNISVQSLKRTFVDKVFAICDYYLNNTSTRISRHIYDLYMIFPAIDFSEDFVSFISKIRFERSKNKKCLSAKNDINISDVLLKSYSSNYFEKDFNETTSMILFDDVEYKTCKEVLKDIANMHIFD